MKVLVVGGGGREHAIIRKLKENPRITELFAAPGNGGIGYDALRVPLAATQVEEIAAWAGENKMDYVVVAPDDPLALGLVDKLAEKGIPAFGPTAAAAQIEASKAFSKDLMKKYHIPTAAYETFTDVEAAKAYLAANGKWPIVVKADGLALGKGVIICQTPEEALNAVEEMMVGGKFGASGSTVVIEEFLTGPEVSVLAFTDGKTMVPMVSSMDHKRALDHDEGLNTGGMGTIAPNPYYTPDIAARCMKEIFLPTMAAMNAEGRTFKGCLYFGLMLTPDGPKVIEYNCRFGDPETQVVLPLLKTDLLAILRAVESGTLGDLKVEWKDGAACCVVLASQGYPQSYEKGFPISLPETEEGEHIYIAGAAEQDGRLVTSGGRVLGAVSVAEDLPSAIEKAYALADRIHFDNASCRRDIGQRALQALKEKK